MSHNNYKKMIFQQTINWLTDLISHNLLCKLVYWLCYLIKASHTHCYLVVSWMKDMYRDFGLAGYSWELAGYSILEPMDWMISSDSGPKSPLHRRHGEPTHTSRNAILSDCLNSSLKILTESEEPNTDSFPLRRLEFKAMIPSLFGIERRRKKPGAIE